MSTHLVFADAIESGASETDYYQRRCSVCHGLGRWGDHMQVNGRVCYLDFSCESCEGTGVLL